MSEFELKHLEGFQVVILSGSESDRKHVDEIRNLLPTYWIRDIDEVLDTLNTLSNPKHISEKTPTFEWRISSAHRNEPTDQIYKDYEDRKNVLYITVAGLSDALSGNAAAQGSGHPVIACPPKPDDQKFTAYGTSTMDAPPLVAPMFAYSTESAALNAAKIVAIHKPSVFKGVSDYVGYHLDGKECTKLTAVIISDTEESAEKLSKLFMEYDPEEKVEVETWKNKFELFIEGDEPIYQRGTVFMLYNPSGKMKPNIKERLNKLPFPVIACEYGHPIDYDSFLHLHDHPGWTPRNLPLAAAMVFGTYEESIWDSVNGVLAEKSLANIKADLKVMSKYRAELKSEK
jgi:phosphoribosylcarboxyaminoimidazole (NCAIR) mutase